MDENTLLLHIVALPKIPTVLKDSGLDASGSTCHLKKQKQIAKVLCMRLVHTYASEL